MNKRELAAIEKKAAKVARDQIGFLVTENRRGRITNRGITVDGRPFWTVDDFYAHYPELRASKGKEHE